MSRLPGNVRVVQFGASSSPLARLAAGAILLIVGVLALVLLLPLALLALAIFLVAWGVGAAARLLSGRGAGVRAGEAWARGASDGFDTDPRRPDTRDAGDVRTGARDGGDGAGAAAPARRRVRNEALDRDAG